MDKTLMATTHLLRNYGIKLLAFTVLLSGVLWALQYFVPVIHRYAWYTVAFFAFQSFVTFFIAGKGIQKEKQNFLPHYFLSMVLRFVFTIILAFIFIAIQTPDLNVFIANFFIIYLLFLVFEIYFLLTNLRANSENQAENGI